MSAERKPELEIQYIPEFRVRNVSVGEYKSGIPLAGWESVQNALYAFAAGHSRKSRAAESHNIDAYNESSGPLGGSLFFQYNNRQNPNVFVDDMLEEAEPQIKAMYASSTFETLEKFLIDN